MKNKKKCASYFICISKTLTVTKTQENVERGIKMFTSLIFDRPSCSALPNALRKNKRKERK